MTSAQYDFLRDISSNDMLTLVSTRITELEDKVRRQSPKWHFVKDELPPEDVPILCVRGGKIYVAWYYNGVYHDDRCCQVQKPYAWKEIILPDLKEE